VYKSIGRYELTLLFPPNAFRIYKIYVDGIGQAADENATSCFGFPNGAVRGAHSLDDVLLLFGLVRDVVVCPIMEGTTATEDGDDPCSLVTNFGGGGDDDDDTTDNNSPSGP
jgi:hypothetical protein